MEFKNSENSTVSIAWIGETTQPNPAKTFITRKVCIDSVVIINGTEYKDTVLMQMNGNSDKPEYDKTKLLDSFNIGDLVDVSFGISSFPKTDVKIKATPKNPNSMDGFVNATCNKITLIKANSTAPVPEATVNPAPSVQTNAAPAPEANGVEDLPF